ncbi:AI-2E family transporter [Thermus thermamylovorans]|uniref:AI-2E family transporter n=1 Tax=Thermus thermamylovorans TaxID=2509362 RepID=A0A4Q9B5N0_9DEIN|nr:AI-2E family transporter [Thermus thermamylovorans]TBH21202.1 AI-2E family transporter [Thermus thermamylovorans]
MREAFARVLENPYVRALLYLLLLLLALRALLFAFQALLPLVLAFALAYLAHPVVRFLEARRLPRPLAVALVYLGLFLFLALFSYLAFQFVAQFSAFVVRLPELLRPFTEFLREAPDRVRLLELPPWLAEALALLGTSLEELLREAALYLLNWFRGLLNQGGAFLGFLAGLAGGVAQFLLALILAAYFLYDLPKIGRALLGLVPEPYQPAAAALAGRLDRAVGGFIRGQLLVASLVGLIVGVGLSLVGVPQAASLGFLAGIFNLIPYVGPVVASVPALLLAATVSPWHPFLALAVILLANQLEAALFGPLIVGRTTRLHPLSAVAGILLGASLFGLWGALLGVPAVAFLKVLLEEYYKGSRFYREG